MLWGASPWRRCYALAAFSIDDQEQDWLDLQRLNRDVLLVAENVQGQVIGYALSKPTPDEKRCYDCELIALHVNRDFHRQGAGRELLAETARRMHVLGSRSLGLWVLDGHPPCGFYEHLGGQAHGEQFFEIAEFNRRCEVGYLMYRSSFLRVAYMSASHYTIQNHNPSQIDNLAAFFERYRKAYPDAKLQTAELYTYHPAVENGQNVFLALDPQGQVRGFAPLFPAPVSEESAPSDPHHIWMILLAEPEAGQDLPIRESLLEKVMARAASIAAGFPPFRRTRLASDMMASQRSDITFLEQHGFERYDGMYVMQRATTDPVPDLALPAELTLRSWKIASEAERQQYLRASNKAFPDNPKSLETLRFLLDSPMWQAGTAVAAFDLQDELVASILVYPNEGRSFGITDDVFVLPAWRGWGIAKTLIAKGLQYLSEHGFAQVILEVKQHNLPAVSVYQAMGYNIINQEVYLGRFLGT